MGNNNLYHELFDNLTISTAADINKFIELIHQELLKRNIFVKSTGEDSRRTIFFDILRSVLTEFSKENVRFEFVASGHSALVFKIGDKVLKIGKSGIDGKKYRKDFPCLTPLILDECLKITDNEYYTLQISPYVNTQNISKEDAYSLYCELRKLGYIWNDPSTDNIGRIIKDFDYNDRHYTAGQLVVIDLEDISFVGEITPDVVLEEIAMMSYNSDVYKFETRYISEHPKPNRN